MLSSHPQPIPYSFADTLTPGVPKTPTPKARRLLGSLETAVTTARPPPTKLSTEVRSRRDRRRTCCSPLGSRKGPPQVAPPSTEAFTQPALNFVPVSIVSSVDVAASTVIRTVTTARPNGPPTKACRPNSTDFVGTVNTASRSLLAAPLVTRVWLPASDRLSTEARVLFRSSVYSSTGLESSTSSTGSQVRERTHDSCD